MHDLSDRKLDFIQEIAKIEDEASFARLEEALREIQDKRSPQTKGALKARLQGRDFKEKFNSEKIKQRQGWTGRHDKAAMRQLVKGMDIQEPVEQLLAQLRK